MSTVEKMSIEDLISAINHLSLQERKVLEQALYRQLSEKKDAKNILRETFGLWSDRKDIIDSVEYVNSLRKSWSSRLRRLGIV